MAIAADTREGVRPRRTTTSGRGFSTTRVRLRIADEQTPPVASSRGYLRERLPAVYQDGDFGLRFLGALETLLDPIVGTLDVLPAYFDPDLAPRDLLELLAAWFGIEVDESWPDERCRHALRLAAELGRRQGTRSGIELALSIAFPDVQFRVEDGGKVTWATDANAPLESSPRAFVVYCDVPLSVPELAAVARVIERAKPLHVGYRLRVKTPRRRPTGDAK
jgi:phage tail-like protein